jgi:hypothetical protein
MEKQTALDFLLTELDIDKLISRENLTIAAEVVRQAEEMDKQQKKECWDVAHQAGRFEGKGIAEENWQTFEQYYNETFGGKDE